MPVRAAPMIAIIVVLLLAATSLFTINEAQVALRTEFGAIVGLDYSPGLHFKWPWDQVVKFDRRILSLSYTGETFLTNDNRGLIVDFYVKWRVKDASRYFQATGGREDLAGERLAEIVKDGIKSVVAQRTLEQIVSAERAAVTGDMFGQASRNVGNLGIDLVDVRVQRIDLPDDVSTRVYESMKQNFDEDREPAARRGAERRACASGRRPSGSARKCSPTPSGMHCACGARAMLRRLRSMPRPTRSNPEFYAFYRSLQAYERSLGKDGDLLVVTPDGEFFKYLKDPASGKR